MRTKRDQGKRLIQTQLALNLTNSDLAERAKLEPHAISQYRSGARQISPQALWALKEGFGVTSDWILFGDASAIPQSLYAKIRAKVA